MPKSLSPLKRQPRLYLSVQESIKDYILENHLQPGDPLPPETELARQLGVGRNSAREAIKALESLGVLETRRGTGLFVQNFSLEPLVANLQYGLLQDLRELSDLWRVRQVLENGMIAEVISSISAQQLEKIRQTVNRMRQRAEKEEPFAEEDREFHWQLFESLDNQIFLKILDIFWLTFNQAAQHTNLWDTQPQVTYRWHLKILNAVESKDIDAARLALDNHYSGLKRQLGLAQAKGPNPFLNS